MVKNSGTLADKTDQGLNKRFMAKKIISKFSEATEAKNKAKQSTQSGVGLNVSVFSQIEFP